MNMFVINCWVILIIVDFMKRYFSISSSLKIIGDHDLVERYSSFPIFNTEKIYYQFKHQYNVVLRVQPNK